MNKLTQKFLKESGIDQNWNNEDFMVSAEQMSKFAELIVAECMEIVSDIRDLAIEDEWTMDEAMSAAINDIEEHFGVEE